MNPKESLMKIKVSLIKLKQEKIKMMQILLKIKNNRQIMVIALIMMLKQIIQYHKSGKVSEIKIIN